ncbi:conserved Plasmodium protein, unknown function [Plasmodium berghei]|uniref:Uncharacterized protein n=2 Tax=Plasmodium berghei TaxID=5821 RepID=A0A509ALI7_PLABA|nr:conserved Plasmodium protein, unknown function [Plasmodium berghei ANKA]CXI41472.1 conserved Plasmodium protein, unknown function [Plasmodium berghei]SCM21921.1 conserved Plasmodium protein, unknown function [Plasmodium berghei]SCN25162.1 conserved Plasmodium protein, unknown function [Plasmodium berghei]SCO61753.1 conserved Plasmodium protein, unknown function [Plasmodium berghei]VUC55665.1 conserved Plasmodium protein, unknown function [Plasmodium berghei ANKA]|eukprot:XP_034421475.1 conserved Plasmodium protein, unknown function [Plasmodium berghei ANKA]
MKLKIFLSIFKIITLKHVVNIIGNITVSTNFIYFQNRLSSNKYLFVNGNNYSDHFLPNNKYVSSTKKNEQSFLQLNMKYNTQENNEDDDDSDDANDNDDDENDENSSSSNSNSNDNNDDNEEETQPTNKFNFRNNIFKNTMKTHENTIPANTNKLVNDDHNKHKKKHHHKKKKHQGVISNDGVPSNVVVSNTAQPTPVVSTTVQPTPVVSTTVQPTPVASTTVQPTPVASTTVQPTGVASTTVQPTGVVSNTVSPTGATEAGNLINQNMVNPNSLNLNNNVNNNNVGANANNAIAAVLSTAIAPNNNNNANSSNQGPSNQSINNSNAVIPVSEEQNKNDIFLKIMNNNNNFNTTEMICNSIYCTPLTNDNKEKQPLTECTNVAYCGSCPISNSPKDQWNLMKNLQEDNIIISSGFVDMTDLVGKNNLINIPFRWDKVSFDFSKCIPDLYKLRLTFTELQNKDVTGLYKQLYRFANFYLYATKIVQDNNMGALNISININNSNINVLNTNEQLQKENNPLSTCPLNVNKMTVSNVYPTQTLVFYQRLFVPSDSHVIGSNAFNIEITNDQGYNVQNYYFYAKITCPKTNINIENEISSMISNKNGELQSNTNNQTNTQQNYSLKNSVIAGTQLLSINDKNNNNNNINLMKSGNSNNNNKLSYLIFFLSVVTYFVFTTSC